MGRQHVGHAQIAAFAVERVNLPKEIADGHRAQARRLRERLETYLGEHPDFSLRKMLLAGSSRREPRCALSTTSTSPATSRATARRTA